MDLSKRELEKSAVTLYDRLIEGDSEADIVDNYGWDDETFKAIKAIMFETRSNALRGMPREHVYVQYCIDQGQNLRDLTDLIRSLDSQKQYNALVGAIRLRSDIQDKIIARGQEFGIIKKEPERKEYVGGLLIADLSTDDVRKALADKLNSLGTVMSQFGDGDISSLSAGTLHHGPKAKLIIDATPPKKAESAAAEPKSKKAKNGKAKRARK